MKFTKTVERVWDESTGDTAQVVRNLNSELTDLRRSQEDLLMKYVKNVKNILPHFDKPNCKLESEIANVEGRSAACDSAKATREQQVSFSKTMLVDIPTAWGHAGIDQQQEVQNILLPGGLKYHPKKGILNQDNE